MRPIALWPCAFGDGRFARRDAVHTFRGCSESVNREYSLITGALHIAPSTHIVHPPAPIDFAARRRVSQIRT